VKQRVAKELETAKKIADEFFQKFASTVATS
jgi:hypothetical protein